MIPIPQAFSARYAQARVKFLEAAATAGTRIASHNHPLPGRDGEVLGVLGVIGPTRMAYERVIPVVQATADAVGEAIAAR